MVLVIPDDGVRMQMDIFFADKAWTTEPYGMVQAVKVRGSIKVIVASYSIGVQGIQNLRQRYKRVPIVVFGPEQQKIGGFLSAGANDYWVQSNFEGLSHIVENLTKE